MLSQEITNKFFLLLNAYLWEYHIKTCFSSFWCQDIFMILSSILLACLRFPKFITWWLVTASFFKNYLNTPLAEDPPFSNPSLTPVKLSSPPLCCFQTFLSQITVSLLTASEQPFFFCSHPCSLLLPKHTADDVLADKWVSHNVRFLMLSPPWLLVFVLSASWKYLFVVEWSGPWMCRHTPRWDI